MNQNLPNPNRARWTMWLFRVAAMALIPALSFGVLELSLRIFGYGYPTSFFIKIKGRDAYTTNPRFGWRFFPSEIARHPEPCYLPARKDANAFRIFVLGSSAAMGMPEPAFSFGRILEMMLRDQYPGIKFEVVNTAMTAINSHVILPIVRECADHGGDLFIIYSGNNEVVGTYGAGTVFQAYSPSLWMIRTGVWLKLTRTGQLIESLLRWLVSRDRIFTEWQGMEMFLGNQVPADDPRLERVYSHFRQNLADICDVGRRSGVSVILCTVATNLKDNAPFASVHRPDLTKSDLAEWENLYRRGSALAASGQHVSAVQEFLKADRYDNRFADLHFRLAQYYWTLEQFDKAREHFIQARDLDALRFRADTRINEAIRRVGGEREGQGIFLADAEREFELSEEIPHATPGQELFYEHVHMNFDGNYLLARIVFEKVKPILQAKFWDRVQHAVTAPPKTLCKDLIALTGWHHYQMLAKMAEMMDRPPFTHQLDHEQNRLLRYQALKEFRLKYASPAGVQKAQACQTYLKTIERVPDDLYFRQHLASLLQERRDYAAAAEQWRVLLGRIPDNPGWREALGNILSHQGKYAEAVAHYCEMQRAIPGLALPHIQIGVTLTMQGKLSEAAVEFHRALEINPGSEVARGHLGKLLEAQGQPEKTQEVFAAGLLMARQHRDRRAEGIFLIRTGGVCLRQGKVHEALKYYQSALEIDKAVQNSRRQADALTHLGDAYFALRDPGAALKSFESALNLYRQMDDLPGQADVSSRLGAVFASGGGYHGRSVKILRSGPRYPTRA